MAALRVVLVTLVLQALWGSAFSSLLDLHALPAVSDTVDEATKVSSKYYCFNCVVFDNLCYNHTLLFELSAPFGLHPVVKKMGIMESTNVLYYTFEPKFNDPEYSKVAFVSLYSPTYFGVINGSKTLNFGAFDIDQNQRKVYLGGSDGIWVINSNNPIPKSFNETGNFITNIVSNYYMYFTKRGTPGILQNGNSKYIILKNETIKNFVLDKIYWFNVIYLTDTGLFILFRNKSQQTVRLSKDPFIRGLTVDTTGTVYAWHVDGIHKVVLGTVLSESKLKHVSGIIPDAMTFDKYNNIIYSKGNTLYKLTKVDIRYCKWQVGDLMSISSLR